MIRIPLIVALLASSLIQLRAQDTLVLYYDQKFQKTDDSTASNIAVAVRRDSLWQFSMFDASSQKRIISGYYEHDLKTLTGRCEYFFPSGQKRSQGYFHDGLKVGPWEEWDEAGRVVDSSFFSNGEPKYSYMTQYYKDGTIRDFSFDDGVTSGRKYYSDKGVLLTLQEFQGKGGTVHEYYDNGQPRTLTEYAKSGKLLHVTYYSEDGKVISEKELQKRQAELEKKDLATIPEYPGGMGSFQTYLIKNSLTTESNDGERRVQISFMLNEFGRATDIRVINAPNPTVERSIISLIQQMTNWDMKGKKSWPVKLAINMTG